MPIDSQCVARHVGIDLDDPAGNAHITVDSAVHTDGFARRQDVTTNSITDAYRFSGRHHIAVDLGTDGHQPSSDHQILADHAGSVDDLIEILRTRPAGDDQRRQHRRRCVPPMPGHVDFKA